MSASQYDTEAVVLDTTEHGESDLIVTFFTQRSGRLHAIAKGAKKSRKRFVNKLEQFSFLRISYQQKNSQSLAFLREADLHTAFIKLRTDVHLYNVASVMREFLLMAVREGEAETPVFSLTLWALHSLDNSRPAPSVLVLFLLRFFDHIGYRPELRACTACGLSVNHSETYRFDSSAGGLVCRRCTPVSMNRPLSPGTIKMLVAAQDRPLEQLHRLKFSGPMLQESLHLLKNYGNLLFQRDFVSWRSLSQRPV
jgi:DNA repair protein RecO (recombination protein O)